MREIRQANPLQGCTMAADYSYAANAVGGGGVLNSRSRPDRGHPTATIA
jgi:hypothetical protein